MGVDGGGCGVLVRPPLDPGEEAVHVHLDPAPLHRRGQSEAGVPPVQRKVAVQREEGDSGGDVAGSAGIVVAATTCDDEVRQGGEDGV